MTDLFLTNCILNLMKGFAEMLVDCGIDSVSLNPDSVLKVRQRIAKHEALKSGKPHVESKISKGKGSIHKSEQQNKATAQ